MHILCTDFIAIPLCEGLKARSILWYMTLFVDLGCCTHQAVCAAVPPVFTLNTALCAASNAA